MGMATPRSIFDTKGEGTISVETRHKLGWQYPGWYSTEMGMAATRSILDTNGAGCKHVDTRHKWRGCIPVDTLFKRRELHRCRYYTQMARVVSMSILYTNGAGCTLVDTRYNLRYIPSNMGIYKLDWTNTIYNMYLWCSANEYFAIGFCEFHFPYT